MKNLFSLSLLLLCAGFLNAQSLVITPSLSDYAGYGVSSNGATDGYINLSVSGGTVPYTYNWSNGSTDQNIASLAAGTYSVTVTDALSEQAEGSYTLTEPPAALALNLVTADPKCAGASDGWVDAQVSGGTPPYTYSWDGGSSASALYDLSAGNYAVTVTDADANTVYNTAMLNDPTPLGADFNPFVYSNGEFFSCETCDDGRIDVSPYGGTPPYSILWDNGETGFTRENIAVDAPLSATITDFNSCTYTDGGSLPWGVSGGGGSDPLVVTENISLYPNGYNVSDVGMNDGYIELTVSGGLPPYSFNWDHAATTQNVYNLSEGPYGVTVTDDEGTFSYYSYYITAPSSGGSGLDVSDNISMYPNGYNISAPGATDGSIELTPFGGTPPYTFVWDHGPTDQNLYGLGEGMYNVNVYDNAGGNIYKSYYLYGPQQGGGALSVQLNSSYSSCQSYGTIDALVEGGSYPYFYEWEGPNGDIGGNDSYINIYQAGTYTVTVTDDNSDIVTASVEILDDGGMTVTLNPLIVFETYNTSCAGNDGIIEVSINGGTPPYQIDIYGENGSQQSLSTSNNFEQIIGLEEGSMSIQVRDMGGCDQDQFIELTSPPDLAIAVTPTELQGGYYFSCPTCADGEATVQVPGGTGSYTYQWFSFPAGTNFDVDINGASLYFSEIQILLGFDNQNEVIPVPLASGQTVNGLSPQTWYGVMAMDENGCEGGKVFSLEKPKTGAEGPTGPTGADGITGPTGPQGVAGADGTNGTNGVDGATGPQGPAGPQGIAGADGANGTNGVDGATGPQGPTGPQGIAGADGADGTNGVDGATGPQGPTGPQGVAGADGADGTNGVDGATGPQGPTGPQGIAGTDGAVGPTGPAGTDGAQNAWALTGNSGTGNWLGTNDATDLEIKTNNNLAMTVKSDGTVAIGTTTVPAGYMLAVNGKAIMEEVEVRLNADWPDYVFKSDYELLTLEEVEQHIKEKGHLPGLPSAKEVKEEGISLGEMDGLLLKKIEELTLYVLELKEQNEQLQQKVEELSK